MRKLARVDAEMVNMDCRKIEHLPMYTVFVCRFDLCLALLEVEENLWLITTLNRKETGRMHRR